MTEHKINSLEQYLQIIEPVRLENNELLLFRGQSDDKPLLPGIARKDPSIDTTTIEIDMLNHLKRVGFLKLVNQNLDDWDLLILAQHHGMQTRLLDWSSNPLVSLWFAISNPRKFETDSYVYMLKGSNTLCIEKDDGYDKRNKIPAPITVDKTLILKPTLSNERIIGQFGWFTIHNYSTAIGKFIELKDVATMSNRLTKIVVPFELKLTLLNRLTLMGVNAKSIYPDIEGYCKHINWKYLDRVFI